jgi:hypothetical protein
MRMISGIRGSSGSKLRVAVVEHTISGLKREPIQHPVDTPSQICNDILIVKNMLVLTLQHSIARIYTSTERKGKLPANIQTLLTKQ